MSSNASEFFREQALILFEEYRNGKINADEYMKLLGMVYGDYLDNHPEEAMDIIPNYKPHSLKYGKDKQDKK